MVKSEETNHEHADDIEKIRAKKRQQVFTIREQAISKQTDTLSKQAKYKLTVGNIYFLQDMWDLQSRMVKIKETNRQHADDIEKIRAKECQQVFTIREQAEAISKQAETLSKQVDTLSKQVEMISFLTRKDMWDLQARMVKSEETNREHADEIEKIRAKERQKGLTIREQAEAISKQAETLSKQAGTLSKQAEMIYLLTRKDMWDLQTRMVKKRQQVFTIREQAEAISKQAETLSKQADTLSKQEEMISFLTRKDMWDLQARMVKSEETNRQHADDIEKIRAKERQQVFTIREQAISKQADTLSKQA
nr:hypothetical protein [Tanacetum cinerariifolium]